MGRNPQPQTVRLDRWLWAARFYKTRALATQAVAAGHVHLDGQRPKAARKVRPGQEISVVRGTLKMTVVVAGLAERRGPAAEAQLLYEETDPSIRAREQVAQERRDAYDPLLASQAPTPGPRPTKRERRSLGRLKGR